jgi:hypothetical protein
VTDSIEIASDEETLAAGNLEPQDWIAQVTPSSVHAFCLDPPAYSTFASLVWHPPGGTTITSANISSGIVILQCLCNAQHSLIALKLEANTTALQFVHLGDPFFLSDEASCIVNLVLNADNIHAVLAVGI